MISVRKSMSVKTGSGVGLCFQGIDLSTIRWGLGGLLEPEPEVLPTAFRKKEAILILISGRRPTHQALGAQPLPSQSVN